MCILTSPFNNSFTTILFVNGMIHFLMFVLFIYMYIEQHEKNYVYAIIAFGISSTSLISSSICSIKYLGNYERV